MIKELWQTTLGKFRIVAFLEGCSFTMVLKYKYAMPLPNYIVGMAHGILFIGYVGLLLLVARKYNWNLFKVAMAFVASLIPFGTFYADKKLFRQ
jgi:integral membrane protein